MRPAARVAPAARQREVATPVFELGRVRDGIVELVAPAGVELEPRVGVRGGLRDDVGGGGSGIDLRGAGPKAERAIVRAVVQVRGRGTQREHKARGDPVVEVAVEGDAGGELRCVAENDLVEHRPARRQAVIKGVRDLGLFRGNRIRAEADLDAEPFPKRFGIGKHESRSHLVMLAIVRPRGFAQAEVVGIGGERGLGGDLAAFAVERILAAQIDAPRGRIGLHARGGGLADLDGLGAVNRCLLEFKLPGAGPEARGGGAGHAHPVDAHSDIFRVEPANARGAGIRVVIVHHDAGEIFDELTDVAARDVAEIIRRHDILHVQRGALLHDCLRVTLPLGGNHELSHHQRGFFGRSRRAIGRSLQLEIPRDRLPRGHCDPRTRRFITGVDHR